MDLRSKSGSTNNNINPDPQATNKVLPDAMPLTEKIENMSVDEKLNILILSVSKLESVPQDIVTMKNSIHNIQTDIKEIPVLRNKLSTMEAGLNLHRTDITANTKTVEALEVSLTDTKKDVDEFKREIQEFKDKLLENQKVLNNLEAKMQRDEQRLTDLAKKASEEENDI